MTEKEIYQIWAPTGKKWVDWVRPVPFVGIQEHSKNYSFSNLFIPVIECVDATDGHTVVIVDQPGVESVKTGLALAKAGFRPIPIYNGTIEQPGARATVDNQAVGVALSWGATRLLQLHIKDDAPPAFLTDSNRMNRFKMSASLFDNSWDVYHQDLPSADYFLANDITKIVIIGERVSRDLKKILYPFQKKKIQIYLTNGYEKPKKVTLFKPLFEDKDW